MIPLSGEKVTLESGATAWLPCHIGTGSEVGPESNIGALAHVGRDCQIGKGVRIQGGAYLADRTVIGDDVFIGPNATILNDKYPPSKDASKWQAVIIQEQAVIGGNATILPGITIGKASIVAAGSTLTTNMPPGEVWKGSPAKFMMTRAEYDAKR